MNSTQPTFALFADWEPPITQPSKATELTSVEALGLSRVLLRHNVPYATFAILLTVHLYGVDERVMVAAIAKRTGMSRYAITNQVRRSHLFCKPVYGESSVGLTHEGKELIESICNEIHAITPQPTKSRNVRA